MAGREHRKSQVSGLGIWGWLVVLIWTVAEAVWLLFVLLVALAILAAGIFLAVAI